MASSCYYFVPQTPVCSPPQFRDAPCPCGKGEWKGGSLLQVLLRGHLGPALALPPAGSCSQSHPRAAPGPLQACCGPALALPATDLPHLVRPAASCLTAIASSNMFAPGERSKWGLCLPEYPLHQLPQPALPRVSITGLPPLSHGSPAPFLPPGVKSSLTFSRTPL